MSLKIFLTENLPQRFISPRSGVINPYALANELECTPQAVYVWLRDDNIQLNMARKITRLAGASVSLTDFRKYCQDLDSVLTQLETENGVDSQ